MTCETCVYYDSIDDFKFFCDVHGVGLKDDLTPCGKYVPVDGAEEEDNDRTEIHAGAVAR